MPASSTTAISIVAISLFLASSILVGCAPVGGESISGVDSTRAILLRDRLSIPLEAVRTSADGTYVEVQGKGGGPQRRVVELGVRNRARVVVEAGLEAGEVVLLPGAASRS